MDRSILRKFLLVIKINRKTLTVGDSAAQRPKIYYSIKEKSLQLGIEP